ncbi:MAG: hypothetical protein FWF79_03070, partial [Defluviitaleaceae bacterium]|nr:hypothetical protein [Defluviitaleaceae bacterium]
RTYTDVRKTFADADIGQKDKGSVKFIFLHSLSAFFANFIVLPILKLSTGIHREYDYVKIISHVA